MQKAGVVILSIFAFFVLLFLYTKIVGPISFSTNSIFTFKSESFRATGEGVVALKPDVATINAGVTAKGNTVKEAQNQVNLISTNIVSAIKRLGIEDKDIQTKYYNIEPVYDYTSGSQRITGYNASTNLTIKIHNVDLVNQAIDTATGNGANLVGPINFDVNDRTKAEGEARQKAVDQARKKAESAAKIAGFRLGKMINYSENFNDNSQPLPIVREMSGSVGAPPTYVQPGSSEVKVHVTLSYEIF